MRLVLVLSITYLLTASISVAQNSVSFSVDDNRCQVDTTLGIIICNTDMTALPSATGASGVQMSTNGIIYQFVTAPALFDTEQAYLVNDGTQDLTLYFTPVPIVTINSNAAIVDDPKVPAVFTYAGPDKTVTTDMGIELRGGVSQTFPKKTYDLEFWDDPQASDTNNEQFLDMRNDDDWILDAIYNEPQRLRAHMNHQLWLDIHTPYYQADEAEAQSGARARYVEVFLNGSYNGLYMLMEQVDRKQLKLKNFNGTMRGELYKGSANTPANASYEALPAFDNTMDVWGGIEQKLPKADDLIDWNNLYNHMDLVINSTDSVFESSIDTEFHVPTAENYWLYINMLRGVDNMGKNTYLAKYKAGEPYFIVPWDLDLVMGSLATPNGDIYTDYSVLMDNGLFNRLFVNGTLARRQSVIARWNTLRQNEFSTANLIARATSTFDYLEDNKLYEREALVWNNGSFDQAGLTHLTTWITGRGLWLDNYFNAILGVEEVQDTSDSFKLYPNPTSNTLTLDSFSTGSRVTIMDALGRTVHSNLLDASGTVDVSELAPGVYLLLHDNQTARFIKR